MKRCHEKLLARDAEETKITLIVHVRRHEGLVKATLAGLAEGKNCKERPSLI